jgi:serine/threonine-protein kinase
MTQDAVPISPGDMLDGRYRIERIIGEGGMGVVVSAVHVQLRVPVAIKFLRPAKAGNAEVNARFLREARACAHLKNEHIVRVMDFGVFENGLPVLVMEYLEGRDLAAVLAQDGPLAVDEAIDYMLQVAEALAEAHARGIVHRDLKPSNLFLTRHSDGAPLVKVLDFGVSKVIASNAEAMASTDITGGHAMLGSPAYMSPEQIAASPDVDHRADLWALGAILYELLTATMPFAKDNVVSMLAAVINDDAPKLRDRRPDVPEPIADTVERCLAKSPDQRCPDVLAFAEGIIAANPTPKRKLACERIASLLRTVPRLEEDRPSTRPSQVTDPAGTSVTAWRRTSIEKRPKRHRGVWMVVAAVVLVGIGAASAWISRGTAVTPAASSHPVTQDSGLSVAASLPAASIASAPVPQPQPEAGVDATATAPKPMRVAPPYPPPVTTPAAEPTPTRKRDPLEFRE